MMTREGSSKTLSQSWLNVFLYKSSLIDGSSTYGNETLTKTKIGAKD